MKQTHRLGKRSAPAYRRERIEQGAGIGWRSAPDGSIVGTIEVDIDWGAIDSMIRRALTNTTGRCKSGPVLVRAKERHHEKGNPQ